MSDSITIAVRQFEQVIDNGYRSLPIFSRPLDVALYGLLAAYDSHIVSQRMLSDAIGGKPFTVGQVQLFKSRGEGLVWALRWLLEAKKIPDARPLPSEDLISEAAELIEYGAKYYRIGMMYAHFSKGQAQAVVDIGAKYVRFEYDHKYLSRNFSWGFHDSVSNENMQKASRNTQQIMMLQSAAQHSYQQISFHLENGHIVLDAPTELLHPDIQAWSNVVCSEQHIFPATHDMGCFTLQDFNQFWQAFMAWSMCVTEFYLSAWESRSVPQENVMPTQSVSRKLFIETICCLAGLSADIVESITTRLTYDWRTGKPDVFLQPLFCGKESVAWSPGVIQMSRSQRNLLKLMARTPREKSLADNVIGNREIQLLSELQTILERKGWSVALNRNISGNDEAEVDILATNWSYPDEVLIVEAKAFLQADDVNEIKSATLEMQHAQEQVARIIKILATMSLDDRRRLFPFVEWEKVKYWFGVIITPETEPSINYDHSKIPALSLLTLQYRLRAKDWVGPRRIWQAMVQRKWQAFIRDAEYSSEKTELAGITYDLPLISLRTN